MTTLTLSGNTSGAGVFVLEAPSSANTQTLTLPDATTTLVGANATQTLTNKTLTSATLTSPAISGAVVTTMASSVITRATSQTAPPATPEYFDFTGIPSWAKRITVMFDGISPTTTSPFIIQIGSGTVETSSYVGTCHYLGGTDVANLGMSTGFLLTYSTAFTLASGSYTGAFVLTNISSNIWVITGTFNNSVSNGAFLISGTKTISGTLNIVRVTSVSGTNTFDAGSINILYE